MYRNPRLINSPRQHLQVVKIIFDGGVEPGYSIAIVKWDGVPSIAIRWNVTDNEFYDAEKVKENIECVGNPQSRGVPTWFLLPNAPNFQASLNDAFEFVKTIK